MQVFCILIGFPFPHVAHKEMKKVSPAHCLSPQGSRPADSSLDLHSDQHECVFSLALLCDSYFS